MALLDGVLAAEAAPKEQRAELAERFGVERFLDGGRRNEAAVALMEACVAAPSIRPYSATAAFLERHAAGCVRHAEQCRETASRLVALAEHWVSQRLWSLNRVPELVLHDDRHVENVDRLAIQLAGPVFERQCRIKHAHGPAIEDLATLSMAAWLHDWGQIGCRLRDRVVRDPLDVRDLHGPITQELICDSRLRPLHHLEREEGQQVGLLCGHHQGWTSIGNDVPDGRAAVTYEDYFGTEPPSFKDDPCLGGWEIDRAQMLTGLLRVADAADVGQHRIPDVEAHEALLGWRFDELINDVEQLKNGTNTARNLARRRLQDRSPLLATVESDPAAAVHSMSRWVERTKEGSYHYQRHRAVKRVDFVTIEQSGSLRALPTVAPTTEEVAPLAIKAVSDFVAAELAHTDRSYGTVRQILGGRGLWIEREAVLQ
jgi:hypothetical protein